MNDYKLNKEQYRRIKDNNIDYFLENNFDYVTKTHILNQAVSLGKLDIIKIYMEQGLQITNSYSLVELMSLKRKVDILQYLDSKGVNLTDNTHICFSASIKAKNIPFAEYLAPKINDNDDFVVTNAITEICKDFDFSKSKKLIKILVKKISSPVFHSTLNNIYGAEDKKTQLLEMFLKENLAEKSQIKKVKI